MLSEYEILREIEACGFGGDKAREAARRIRMRSLLTPVERANLIDKSLGEIYRGGGLESRERAERALDRLLEEIEKL